MRRLNRAEGSGVLDRVSESYIPARRFAHDFENYDPTTRGGPVKCISCKLKKSRWREQIDRRRLGGEAANRGPQSKILPILNKIAPASDSAGAAAADNVTEMRREFSPVEKETTK